MHPTDQHPMCEFFFNTEGTGGHADRAPLRCGMQAFADPISLTTLPLERIEDAAELSAAAFAGRPNVWRAICGVATPVHLQQRFLAWLFARNLWLRRESGCNRAVVLDGEVVCSFMFVGPIRRTSAFAI